MSANDRWGMLPIEMIVGGADEDGGTWFLSIQGAMASVVVQYPHQFRAKEGLIMLI